MIMFYANYFCLDIYSNIYYMNFIIYAPVAYEGGVASEEWSPYLMENNPVYITATHCRTVCII